MNNQQKKAIVVSIDNAVSEIIQLADTLEYSVVKEFIQKRKLPDVNFYVGSGKLDEIKEFIYMCQRRALKKRSFAGER